jgi:REP element-mobilizing transposase RayT
MGHTSIWIHLVWTTKNRQPILNEELRHKLFQHIRDNAETKGIHVDFINGYLEHVHCLISLCKGQNIDTILKLLKGESSHWINQNRFLKGKFEWQDDYFAVSVSESIVNRVRDYIKNQENHHRKKPFREEYDEFIRNYYFKPSDRG